MECAPLTFLGRPLPAGFALRVTAIAPGEWIAYVADEWRDGLVVVERGEVELDCTDGARFAFALGSVLWLAGLPVRALHNPGEVPAVLTSVSRRPMSSDDAEGLNSHDR